ncbi:hypothetical protein BIW11_02821 [Tropilaelaps mercedesae]|uniref:Uncharacterized protein n=1 Tax=Tropilaelaps mercedesae TaxID=418985 RepID=A0A1V9XWS5_9ACAR|nr:hypothetical protein BIW11_02821 [Tropilaelaps mercedesae]
MGSPQTTNDLLVRTRQQMVQGHQSLSLWNEPSAETSVVTPVAHATVELIGEHRENARTALEEGQLDEQTALSSTKGTSAPTSRETSSLTASTAATSAGYKISKLDEESVSHDIDFYHPVVMDSVLYQICTGKSATRTSL